MNPTETLIALLPLAAYFGMIGVIPFYRRPLVRSGGSDLFFLLLGLGGFIMIGPVKLLFPVGALMFWKGLTFLLLVAVYVLIAILIAGIRQPRIVVYNVQPKDFLLFLTELEQKSEVRTVGNCVQIPVAEIQFSYEVQPYWQCVVLKSTSPKQNLAGWTRLEQLLREKLTVARTPFTSRGLILPLMSVLLFALSFWRASPLLDQWFR